eukprot:COSAG04_NODE_28809_length_273_cov_0.597701_1_plen_72_part_01
MYWGQDILEPLSVRIIPIRMLMINSASLLFIMRIVFYLLRGIYMQTPLRFKLGGRPVLIAHLNVETAGSEPK